MMIQALILVCNIGYHVCDREYALRQYTQMVPESECGRSFPGDGRSQDGWPAVGVGEVRKVECIYSKTPSVPQNPSTSPSELEAGMYLCLTPADANNFWEAITKAEGLGAVLNNESWAHIAAKQGCPFIQSNSFRPIRFVYSQFLLKGAGGQGWAHPDYFIGFENRMGQ
jgi:hypothetical protein